MYNWPLTIGVSASVNLPVVVQNFPLTTNISGTVTANAVIQNWPATINVSGTVNANNGPANVYTSGLQGVSGAVSLLNWPLTMGVSASVNLPVMVQNQPLTTNVSGTIFVTQTGSLHVTVDNPTTATAATIQNWPLTIGVSGSVTTSPVPTNVYTSGLQGISGAVSLLNWPLTLGVSASVNLPVVVQNQPLTTNISGGIVVQNWPALIGVSGTVSTTTGPTNVYTSGLQGVSGAVNLLNWPLTIGVSASISLPVVIQNQPLVTNVSGTVTANAVIQNWPLTMNVSGTVGNFGTNVYTSGPQAVSGGVNLTNWPAVHGVSGSIQSGSVASAPIYPVLLGGLDQNNVVRPIRVDPQGRAVNQCTGRNVTSITGSVVNETVLYPNPNRVGAIIFNEGPATMYAKFGQVASLTSYTVQIGAKAYFELPFTWTGQIDAIFSAATGSARITELT